MHNKLVNPKQCTYIAKTQYLIDKLNEIHSEIAKYLVKLLELEEDNVNENDIEYIHLNNHIINRMNELNIEIKKLGESLDLIKNQVCN